MHDAFLQQAIELAASNSNNGEGGPYGALIVKDNQVIAASANKVTYQLDPTAHAEILAIRQACQKVNNFKLTGCVLYTSCEPCPMCLGAIYWARLDKVYFASTRHDAAAAGFDDSFIYDQINLSPKQRTIPMLHIEMPYANRPFALWQTKTSKVLY
jgi:guanine deaminase